MKRMTELTCPNSQGEPCDAAYNVECRIVLGSMQCTDEAFESTLNHIFNEGFLALHHRTSGFGDLARVLRIQAPATRLITLPLTKK
jgi:hypothetical protein